ncbi:MAG: cellulase family glycosylhydrolase [Prolixibacteraceae bacterium]|jgi:hypothetical protein|nr:cellulase family glycosylhydrolase [Prolixibacteraceae bacterium]
MIKKILCILIISILLTPLVFGQPLKKRNITVTESGRYVVGCNYWASHAGTNMWKDWRPDIVEADLKQISESGMRVIRIFPLWPDFQPIVQYYKAGGSLKEVRFKNGPLPDIGPGKDGLDEIALQHFKEFADMAEKQNIKLIVGLITGWMSGRLFVPPALEGRDILSDPYSLMWQVKFVRNMVQIFKNHPAILAWDLGNECNVMGSVENRESAYTWTALIANTIKAEDADHPLLSGMHGLSSDEKARWRIEDQAELTDVLTTHPYPIFTPFANQDPINTIRPLMHSAAQSRMYADVGGKPCLVEETGILGPFEANEETKSKFLRTILFNNWAYNNHGLLWWCAYDQDLLAFPPYEWNPAERNLGLFRNDRSPKPVADELKNFSKFLDGLPFESLPVRNREAVCILTEGQDQWGVAYTSFILAKQAGFDIEFQKGEQPLKEAPLYLLPSIKDKVMPRSNWLALLDKVKDGAILYVSYDQGVLSHFIEPAGIEIVSGQDRTAPATFVSNVGTIKPFSMGAPRKLNLVTKGAKVLATEKDGNPVFTVGSYGKGKIYFLGLPVESGLIRKPGSFTDDSAECWKIYNIVAGEIIKQSRAVTKTDPLVGITEHDLSVNKKIIVLINFGTEDKKVELWVKNEWKITRSLYGSLPEDSYVSMRGNDACVFLIEK